jgi:hypothetical protein
MKKLLFSALAFVLTFGLNAQIETPQASPFAKMEQVVGLTDVSIEYSRPAMRGRTIFGDLVPYDKLWRTGANKNTQITFGDDVTIDGQTMKAGTYAIFTKPGTESWEVIFYSDANNWGTPQNWDDTKIAAKTTAKTYLMEYPVESFTISLGDLTNNSAVLGFLWEKTYVPVKFEVPTDVKTTASIDKAMAGPGANDYYSAAVYYLQEGKDLTKASNWMDKAIEMRKATSKDGTEPFWMMRQKSLLHAKMGDKKGAIKAAKRSLELAEKAGNADYVKMNKDSLKEWM